MTPKPRPQRKIYARIMCHLASMTSSEPGATRPHHDGCAFEYTQILTFIGTIDNIVAQITVHLLLRREMWVLCIERPIRIVECEVVVSLASRVAYRLQARLDQPRFLALHLDNELCVHVIFTGNKEGKYVWKKKSWNHILNEISKFYLN